jgi:hypothetical protein
MCLTTSSPQNALLIDMAAKILADNLASPMCAAATAQARLAPSRRCNCSYAAGLTTRALAPVLLCIGDVAATVRDALSLLARVYQRHLSARSRPRPDHHVRPHPNQCYMG